MVPKADLADCLDLTALSLQDWLNTNAQASNDRLIQQSNRSILPPN